jgi:hypothetical protein
VLLGDHVELPYRANGGYSELDVYK